MKQLSSQEPAWEVATLFPNQGLWTEEDYFLLPGNHLVEFSGGNVEVLAMPSERHQTIVIAFMTLLLNFVSKKTLGKVLLAPFRIKLWEGKFREPDVMFMLADNAHKRFEQYWEGADLVAEVISPDDPKRDTITKKEEYAKAGIKEYWLIHPEQETVTLFYLPKGKDSYVQQAVLSKQDKAVSTILNGFEFELNQLFSE